jgi:hypothetical protein
VTRCGPRPGPARDGEEIISYELATRLSGIATRATRAKSSPHPGTGTQGPAATASAGGVPSGAVELEIEIENWQYSEVDVLHAPLGCSGLGGAQHVTWHEIGSISSLGPRATAVSVDRVQRGGAPPPG